MIKTIKAAIGEEVAAALAAESRMWGRCRDKSRFEHKSTCHNDTLVLACGGETMHDRLIRAIA